MLRSDQARIAVFAAATLSSLSCSHQSKLALDERSSSDASAGSLGPSPPNLATPCHSYVECRLSNWRDYESNAGADAVKMPEARCMTCPPPPPPPPKCYPHCPPPPHPINGLLYPKFYVVAVLYAPPGTPGGGGGATSFVDYSNGSSVGAITSASNSFSASLSVTVKVGSQITGGASIGVTVGGSNSTTNTQTVAKTSTSDWKVPGPLANGIDHDYDQIYLWLNPTVALTLDGNALSWGMTEPNGVAPNVIYLTVGQLKGTVPIDPGTMSLLQQAGFAPNDPDFAVILNQDPLATSPQVDPNRYQLLPITLPYEPPTPGDGPSTHSYGLSQNNSTSFGVSHQTTFSASASVNSPDIGASLAVSGQATFVNGGSTTASNGAVQSASVTVGTPSSTYTGPTLLQVYWDTAFNSFALAFVDTSSRVLSVVGTVSEKGQTPAADRPVTMTGPDGVVHTTYTNAKGMYRFYDASAGNVVITSGATKKNVSVGRSAVRADLPNVGAMH
jgi:hypothetical protein